MTPAEATTQQSQRVLEIDSLMLSTLKELTCLLHNLTSHVRCLL